MCFPVLLNPYPLDEVTTISSHASFYHSICTFHFIFLTSMTTSLRFLIFSINPFYFIFHCPVDLLLDSICSLPYLFFCFCNVVLHQRLIRHLLPFYRIFSTTFIQEYFVIKIPVLLHHCFHD